MLPKLVMPAVDRLNHVEFIALLLAGEPLVHQVLDRLLLNIRDLHAGVSDGRALHRAGQESGAPVLRAAMRKRRLNRDVARQIAIFRAQAVEHPGAHARAA